LTMFQPLLAAITTLAFMASAQALSS
jgi:hypothetical protein